MVVADLALVTVVKDLVVVLEFTTVAVESLLCEESREVVGMAADTVVLDGDSEVAAVAAVVVVVIAAVVVDGASQLYPAAAPLCWQHVSQQTWPFTEQSPAERPAHHDAWSPYGQEGPSHGVANAGQAKQHLDLTLGDCLQELPVTVAHTSAEFEYNGSVESPIGQSSKVTIVKNYFDMSMCEKYGKAICCTA